MKKMKFGIIYEQGDILIVPFPFTDLSAIKQRPVLVLSNKEYNSKTEDIITCGITSNLKDDRYSILISNSLMESGSLPVASRIKVDKLFTVHQSTVRKNIAKLNKKTIEKVKQELFRVLN